MLVIVGFVVVIGCVLGGFTIAGGHIHALIHPSELLTIGGAALGALITMSPKKVLVDLIKGIIASLKPSPFGKKSYEEMFQLMFELFRLARRNGLLTLEQHVSNPHDSAIFSKYPLISKNHHATEFICGALKPIIDGSLRPEQLPRLLEVEIKTMEEEHHAPLNVLSKTADGLPGFGIVAAVLGIVITMGAIDGPVEEIGHKVGAALVGTFLGILLSYGFFAPLAVKMEFMGIEEIAFFRTVSTAVLAFVNDNLPPKVAVELARRGVGSECRPSQEQLDALLDAVE